jgi:lysophospholipase L1-like esterase
MKKFYVMFLAAAMFLVMDASESMLANWAGRSADCTVKLDKNSDGTPVLELAAKEKDGSALRNTRIPVKEFEKLKMTVKVSGKGQFQYGFHLYSGAGYIITRTSGWTDIPAEPSVLDIERIIGQYQQGAFIDKGCEFYVMPTIYLRKGAELRLEQFACHVKPAEKAEIPEVSSLLLPETIYAVPGVETNLYFDNIFLAPDAGSYMFDVDCPKGSQFAKRWSFVPAASDAGTYNLTLKVSDGRKIVAYATSRLVVAPPDAGKDKEISVLLIGDSITDVTTYPARFHALVTGVNNPKMKMIGSHSGSGGEVKSGGIAHEGYAGWAWSSFLTLLRDVPGNADRRTQIYASSKFLKRVDGKVDFDFQYYLDRYNDGKAPDYIVILLGINDIFGASDLTVYDGLREVLNNADALIGGIRKAAPKTQIGIGLITLGAGQDAYGKVYRCSQTAWRYKINNFLLNQAYIRTFSPKAYPGVSIVPIVANLDCENNFPTEERPINLGNPVSAVMQSDGLHPAPAGGNQIGDTVYAWLKCHLNGK